MKTKIEYFKNYFHKDNKNLFILNKDDSYVENFGKQWIKYRNIQIDSINGFNHSREMLLELCFNKSDIFKDKEVLKFCLNNSINWVQSQRDGIIRGIKSRKNWDKLWYSSIEEPIIKNKFSVSKIS